MFAFRANVTRLLFAVCKAPTIFQRYFGGGLQFCLRLSAPFVFYLGGGLPYLLYAAHEFGICILLNKI